MRDGGVASQVKHDRACSPYGLDDKLWGPVAALQLADSGLSATDHPDDLTSMARYRPT